MNTIGTVSVAVGLLSVSAVALVCRLFFLPGALRARLTLLHFFANNGRVRVKPRRFPKSSKLSPCVIRVMGMNPGSFTMQGTNTYVLGTGRERILVDTGEGRRAYMTNLLNVLKEERATIEKIILTHSHFDHVGGLKQLRQRYPRAKVYKRKVTDDETDIDGKPLRHLSPSQQLSVDGASVRVLYTPGHTRDHVALYLQEDNALFTGDCVLGGGTAVFEHLKPYMSSLRKLRSEINSHEAAGKGAVKLYPGHGDVVVEGKKQVEEYIHHRQVREEQLLKMLEEKREVELERAVRKIYADQRLNFILKFGARRAIRQHMEKLEKEGVAKRVGWFGERWKRTA